MSLFEQNPGAVEELTEACEQTRSSFSAYLDGALDGRTMAQLAAHMRACTECEAEFAAWRSMQTALAELGPAQAPVELQAILRDALATEIGNGRHLSPWQRFVMFSREILAPAGLRLGAGLAATVLVLGSGAFFLGSAMPVQANDERMAHINPPQFLYAQAPTQPITSTGRFDAVMVDAKVDAEGRVYDFDLLEGPRDAATHQRLQAYLLESVFKPATVFGERVPGHAMMTFTTVSARS